MSPAGAVARGTHPLSPPTLLSTSSRRRRGQESACFRPSPARFPGAPILWPRDPYLLPGRFPVSGRPSAAHRSFIPSLHLLLFTFAGVLSLLFCPGCRLLASLSSSSLLPWLILPSKVWCTPPPPPPPDRSTRLGVGGDVGGPENLRGGNWKLVSLTISPRLFDLLEWLEFFFKLCF